MNLTILLPFIGTIICLCEGPFVIMLRCGFGLLPLLMIFLNVFYFFTLKI